MKKYFFLVLVVLLSCDFKEKSKKNVHADKLEIKKLNIKFSVTNYSEYSHEHYDDRERYTSRIGMSDSILLISNDNMFNTQGKLETKAWKNGVTISSIEDFETEKSKYNLNEISMTNFINQKNDSVSIKDYPYLYKGDFSFIRKLKNDIIVQFDDVNTSKEANIDLIFSYRRERIKVKIDYGAIPEYPAIFLHDITGDGIEEVFVGEFFVNGKYSIDGFITNEVYSVQNKLHW